MFLNTFLLLSKKAKINNFQVLDILYKKLSNEFKDWLVIIRKVKNFNNLILLFCNINISIKKTNKHSHLHINPNISNVPTIKPLFKSYNPASTKPSTVVEVAVVFSVFSITTETYLGSLDIFNMIKQGLILQKEKDRCNNLGLCHYFGKSGYIDIDYKIFILLIIKKKAASIFMGNFIALVFYKPLFIEEKKTFLS